MQSLVSDRKTVVIESDIGTEVNMEDIKKLKGVQDIFADENVFSIECSKESECIGEISEYFRKNNIPIRSINMGRISLETVFLSLTGRSLRD